MIKNSPHHQEDDEPQTFLDKLSGTFSIEGVTLEELRNARSLYQAFFEACGQSGAVEDPKEIERFCRKHGHDYQTGHRLLRIGFLASAHDEGEGGASE